MTSSLLLSIVTFIYGAAAALDLTAWIFKKVLPGKLASALVVVAVRRQPGRHPAALVGVPPAGVRPCPARQPV